MCAGEQDPEALPPTEETLRIRRERFPEPAPTPRTRVNLFALVSRVKTQNPAKRNLSKGWGDLI